MNPIDQTTPNWFPPALHLIGVACSSRLPRPFLHRIDLFHSESTDRVRAYGRVTARDDSVLLQFNSCMTRDGRLVRHTVFFTESGKHRVVVDENGMIEVVQLFNGGIHVENRSADHAPVTESFVPLYIRAKWNSLLQGHRLLVTLIRLPHLHLQTCEIVRGDAYSCNGKSRIDVVLRAQKVSREGILAATGIPAVLTFDAQTGRPVSYKGVATYVGESSITVRLQFAA